jgi:RecB family exonuclease
MTEVWSFSRLTTYEQCPARYAYTYLLALEPEADGVESVLGKLVHEAIAEHLYARGTPHAMSVSQSAASFRAMWTGRLAAPALPPVRIVRQDYDLHAALDGAEQMLRQALAVDLPEILRTGGIVAGVERGLRAELGGVPWTGTLDLLILRQVPERLEIHDWKTSKKTSRQATVDVDPQLPLYELLLRRIDPGFLAGRLWLDQPIRLVWHFLRTGTVRTSMRTPDDLERLEAALAARTATIAAAQEFPHRPGPLCGWCEHRRRCPASHFHGEPEGVGIITACAPAQDV